MKNLCVSILVWVKADDDDHGMTAETLAENLAHHQAQGFDAVGEVTDWMVDVGEFDNDECWEEIKKELR